MGSWNSKPLGEVCQFINRGISPAYLDVGGVAVLNQKCVRDHAVNFDFGRRHDAEVKKVAPDRLVRAGDVLVNSTGTGTLGRVAQLRDDPPEPTTVDSHVTIVRPREGLFYPEFFGYALVAIEEQIQAGGEGCGGQTELSRTKLAEGYHVSFPTNLDEQRRIVAILDETFEGIAAAKANAEKNLQNARELFAGHLHAVFSQRATGWVTKTVQQWVDAGVLAKPQDGNHGEIHPTKADYVDVGVPFIMASDMIDGRVDTEGCRFISRAQASSLRIGFAKAGDVLLSHKGTIGRVAVLDTPDDYVILTPQVTYYRSLDSDRLFNGFLYYCLLSPKFQAVMNRIAGVGSTRAYIGITKQLELQIALPPVDVQRNMAAWLRQIEETSDRLCELYQAKIAALDELKKSLLHQAFTGQLGAGTVLPTRAAPPPRTSSPQFAAAVISLAHERHRQRQRDKTFGHVKQQKLLHLVEALARVDLGRLPMKDAAGPNDFPHQLKAEKWARQNGFYDVMQRDGGGYDFKRLSGFDKLLGDAPQVLGSSLGAIESVIDLLIPMDSQEAELFATVHAAWNNLLIDGAELTDEAIVREARDTWHPDKLKIPKAKFHQTIALIRSKGLVPDGSGKYVGGQTQLI